MREDPYKNLLKYRFGLRLLNVEDADLMVRLTRCKIGIALLMPF